MSEGGSYEQFYEGVGALISGSTTYEFVLDHLGPRATSGPTQASPTGC